MKIINEDFYGDTTRWFIGVVEDNKHDPMQLGRVRVRAFGVHSPYLEQIAVDDLPWATVLMPSTEGGVSGVGRSPNGIEQGAWVFGMFLDGELSQNPIIFGSIPKVELIGENINPLPITPGATSHSEAPRAPARGVSNAEKVAMSAIDRNMPPAAAAAMVGALAVQSNVNLEPAFETFGEEGSTAEDAFGIAQWEGERKQDFFEYAAENNLDPNTLETQYEFIYHELKTKPELGGSELRNAKTVSDATDIFTEKYLQIQEDGSILSRKSFARDAYERFLQ